MRGSPLIRTLVILIALALTGLGIGWLGSQSAPAADPRPETDSEPSSTTIDTPFVLTLSAPAREIVLESAGQRFSFPPTDQVLGGTLPLEEGHHPIFITVTWQDPEPLPRFAKLVLEPEGFPTQKRTFDSHGELSDAWELHLHP